ncbi:alanine racemase [Planosporangium mesophilum]|uniref:Diaminopimelate decarboxylase n=1 Tax=Planosporangium mesophilum TaxID=689768 RepID=A0A8J3TBP8_9ACTN|nr:alanine racemase [Planosporangium mesophilum]NJC82987.1 type III PLP-dependent enzyme [Planosporangium mesophilum]GII22391.1 diaminopimelate decarboxylase [Planosporangium mesophilum]
MIPPKVTGALAALPRPVCAYVYDREVLRRTAAEVRAALPAGALLLYAVKANGHPQVVAALAEVVDGLEVASGGELALATQAGAATIAFGGPAKTDTELAAAVSTGTLVHAESLLELRRLAAVAGGRPVRVALRVNRPGAGLSGSHAMTGVPTPFGIEEAALGEAVALVRGLPALRLVGFHLHAVSNNLDAAAHAAYVADALDWALATARRLGVDLSYVNVGGGFGVDYTGNARFDLAALRAGLAGIALPEGVTLAFEPGRYLAAPAGWYAAEVLDLKRTHGRWFAVLRGGTHHFRLPAAWGYSHPATVLARDAWPYPFERPEVRDAVVDVTGELCTPRDVLARDLPVDRLRVGDVLVFGNTGGYGWDISHHDFLRHPYPSIAVI